MLPSVVQSFWISIACTFVVIASLLFPVVVQAQQQSFSSNPDDYEFSWLVFNFSYNSVEVPRCGYCVNAVSGTQGDVNESQGLIWNRTVGLSMCDSTKSNEIWAYDVSTSSIVLRDLKTMVLCLDAVLWYSMKLLKVRECNTSVDTQRWIRDGFGVRNGGYVETYGKYLYSLAKRPPSGSLNYSFAYTLTMADMSDQMPANFDFMFLPIKPTLVDTSGHFNQSTGDPGAAYTGRLTTKGLLQLSTPTMFPDLDIITNGNFDLSTVQAETGDITATSPNPISMPQYFSLCGWVIDNGPVEYVREAWQNPFNLPPYGPHVIHLNALTVSGEDAAGSISQAFMTNSGVEYSLSFFLTWFPSEVQPKDSRNCGAAYNEARLQVQVAATDDFWSLQPSNGSTRLMWNFNSSIMTDVNSSVSNMTWSWTPITVRFTAWTDMTTISFKSLNFNSSCGPMISLVEVLMSPPTQYSTSGTLTLPVLTGSIAGLVGLVALVSLLYRILSGRAREDYADLYKTERAKVYSTKELSSSTKKFSSVLGEGGFGTVYKADFADGTMGAVKVEKPKGPNSSSKVLASDEVAVLLRVHHRNLVNLTGFCIDKGRHYLVFEYLPNGSLYDRLHRSIRSNSQMTSTNSVEPNRSSFETIRWKQRLKIASDIACGLEYLHHEADPPVVHRDVKSKNILLTATDSAKLADFGLSKAAPVDATSFQSIETLVKGSFGYLDPQYFKSGVFSPKSDVYSFGVLLLELISGHPAIYDGDSVIFWADPYMASPSLYHELVDKKLNGQFDADELQLLVDLSRRCIQGDGKMRPSMRQVVAVLHGRQDSCVDEGAPKLIEESPSTENDDEKTKPLFIDYYVSQPQDSSVSLDNFHGNSLETDIHGDEQSLKLESATATSTGF